jgi:hypothetical protein
MLLARAMPLAERLYCMALLHARKAVSLNRYMFAFPLIIVYVAIIMVSEVVIGTNEKPPLLIDRFVAVSALVITSLNGMRVPIATNIINAAARSSRPAYMNFFCIESRFDCKL